MDLQTRKQKRKKDACILPISWQWKNRSFFDQEANGQDPHFPSHWPRFNQTSFSPKLPPSVPLLLLRSPLMEWNAEKLDGRWAGKEVTIVPCTLGDWEFNRKRKRLEKLGFWRFDPDWDQRVGSSYFGRKEESFAVKGSGTVEWSTWLVLLLFSHLERFIFVVFVEYKYTFFLI